MSLNPRLVAIQGIGFSPIQIAIQGLLEELKKEPFIGGGSAPGKRSASDTRYKAYIDSLNRDFERQSRIRQEDQLATEFIMSLVHTGILDGHPA